ncbi:hypothetical protein PBAC_26730 [Pedobacter glucosidilyticus]|nr:DUF3800 domain-containing protein [Pedobacter glucosidilyticus]KHJ37138.1 hypothetical protein PBAC_26730 [Pedobacter glucosidilyticus]
MNNYNIYIDESCHLANDDSPVMCIGYTKIKAGDYEEIKNKIKEIKLIHKSPTEIKWNKLSLSRLPLYKSLVDFFFNTAIDFRCVLIKNKNRLDHTQYNQGDPNNFYYKTVYLLLNKGTNPIKDHQYKVLLDIKDTRGRDRLKKLSEVFNNKYQGGSPFIHLQHIHSHESELLQLTDLFIGAITYKSRYANLAGNASKVKVELIKYLEQKSGYQLDEGTEPWETKFNIFDFQPKKSN